MKTKAEHGTLLMLKEKNYCSGNPVKHLLQFRWLYECNEIYSSWNVPVVLMVYPIILPTEIDWLINESDSIN